MNGHHDAVLIATRILMFVTDDNRVSPGHSRSDHRMPFQKRGYSRRQSCVAVLAPSNPSSDVGRKAEANMIGGSDLANQAVYGADFDSRSGLPCPFGKDGTGGVGVGQD